LGYRNTSKALRHLDHLLLGGEPPTDFHKRLAIALDIEPLRYEAAIEATRAFYREEKRKRDEAEIAAARAAFKPHLRVIPERTIPQPIFVAAMTGVDRWLRVPLPAHIMTLAEEIRMKMVSTIAPAHFKAANGRAGPFGKICGYLFRYEFEKAIVLDIHGQAHGEHNTLIREGKATLYLNGRAIPPSLWTR